MVGGSGGGCAQDTSPGGHRASREEDQLSLEDSQEVNSFKPGFLNIGTKGIRSG